MPNDPCKTLIFLLNSFVYFDHLSLSYKIRRARTPFYPSLYPLSLVSVSLSSLSLRLSLERERAADRERETKAEPTTNPSIAFDGLDLLHAGLYSGTVLSLSFTYMCSFLPFLLDSYRCPGQKSRITFF
jgi:hypothetical protein